MTDVARLAGVSAQTVSRTLSNHPHVQSATRSRVLAAVEQLGYRRNSAARALSSGRARMIGVVMHHTASYAEGSLSVGIERAAREAGYAVTIATTTSVTPESVEVALAQVADQGADGLIVTVPLIRTTHRFDEITRTLPTIATDGSRTPWAEVVAVDQRQIGRLATEHLLGLGHETVWHVTGPDGWLESGQRREGWRDALAAADAEMPPELRGDWSAESGYRAGLIIGRIPNATAVFAASDEMAFGVLRALHELGRAVPDDVSVIGVDDIPLAAYASPPLTTVAQPFERIGALAVAHLLRFFESDDALPEHHTVESSLVVRSSTAPPHSVRGSD